MKLLIFIGTGKNTTDILDIFNDNSCIATYNLDGDVTDLSGNNDGTATNLTYTDGKFGQSAVFNGINSKINTSLRLTLQERTISFWFKTSTTDGVDWLTGTAGGTSNVGYWATFIDGEIQFRASDGSSAYFSKNLTGLNDGNWHFACLSLKSGDSNLYIDNVLQENSITTYSTLSQDNYNLCIGYYNNTNTHFLNGEIDQFRIFNRALNSDEVTKLYNEIGR